MHQPCFSIIIPHHNTPKLLSRLLDSIPWALEPEVIVVDDASSPKAQEEGRRAAEEHAAQWYSICRHTAGAARNEGLKHATGRWLVFADADDYFTAEVTALLTEHQADEEEVVYFGVESRYSDSGDRAYRDLQVCRLIERTDKEGRLDALRALHTNPWGKMIARDLVQREAIGFEEIPSANDAMFSVRCGIEAKAVSLDRRTLYCVTVSDDSMTSNVSQDRFESNGDTRLRVNRYLRQKGYGRYQLSVLGYALGSWRYGFAYGWGVWRKCLKSGSSLWVGAGHLLNPVQIKHSLKSRPKR